VTCYEEYSNIQKSVPLKLISHRGTETRRLKFCVRLRRINTGVRNGKEGAGDKWS